MAAGERQQSLREQTAYVQGAVLLLFPHAAIQVRRLCSCHGVFRAMGLLAQ